MQMQMYLYRLRRAINRLAPEATRATWFALGKGNALD